MSEKPFNILSLNGGGVRGIFQAMFLKHLQKELNAPLYETFDLIAGTSTGSIIASAVALDIDISRIIDLYRNKAETIFKSKFCSSIRRGVDRRVVLASIS
ncbi:patatin-like phospholipase family protein [Desulfobacula sp.]|uniref:patatin-like phospholipase family protein n=1 Tax=Desulfobacula sp. TaxID=2593537 RepID=UPI002631C136|nr:patatin-like phospholipase family protein [Desulfobacula sp.]